MSDRSHEIIGQQTKWAIESGKIDAGAIAQTVVHALDMVRDQERQLWRDVITELRTSLATMPHITAIQALDILLETEQETEQKFFGEAPS